MTALKAQSCRSNLQPTPPLFSKLLRLFGIEKVNHIDPERLRDPLQHQDRGVAHTALDARYVAAVKAAVGGKVFLRDLTPGTKPPNIPTDALPDLHCAGRIGS